MDSTPRIAPLEPPFDPEVESTLKRIMPARRGVAPLAIFRLLVRDLKLARAGAPLGGFFLGHTPGTTSDLSDRDREIVIDRVCARCACEYEWGVHIAAFAQQVGLTDPQIAATVHGTSTDPAWTPRDALLIALVDALHDTNTVSDELWTELKREWSEEQLLQLLILSGWYHAISYLLNATQTTPEPWAPRFPMRA